MAPPRVVLDTNVLIAAAWRPGSASARLVAACLDGRLQAVVSTAALAEYHHLIPQATRRAGGEALLARLLAVAERIEPDLVSRRVADDPSDDKWPALAEAAGATLVTSDHHLLELAEEQIQPPAEAVRVLLGE